jgi:hypothetical protein
MSRTEKARGIGKSRKDHEPLPVAKKSFTKPVEPERRPIADIDHTRNTWSVKIAAAWAGVPERTLYRMLRESMLPCIAMGDVQQQRLPTARSGKRIRRCYRFIIPRVAFMRAWESIGAATVGNSAA